MVFLHPDSAETRPPDDICGVSYVRRLDEPLRTILTLNVYSPFASLSMVTGRRLETTMRRGSWPLLVSVAFGSGSGAICGE